MQQSSTISAEAERARVLEETREFFNKPKNRVSSPQRPIDKFAFDEIVKLIPRGSKNQTALDLGCHWGRISTWLADSYGRVIGVDFAEKAIESAERRPNIEYLCLDLNTAADQLAGFGAVDVIVAVGLFEMIENPAALCRQLAKVAKKSCKILVLIPNRMSLNYVSFRSALWVSRSLFKRPRFIHSNGYSIHQLEECFKSARFRVQAKGSVVGVPLYLGRLLPSILQDAFLKLDRFFLNFLGGSYHWICCQFEAEE
jgi:2-polyprenyl-3-methyl-5-hydroxy-6-metoxy-1,4-benzoquinol methylase